MNRKDGGSASASMVSMAALQKKVKSLEEENILLKVETAQLSNETDDYEERETGLIHDCVRQLTETTERLQMLQEELYTKTEVTVSLQEKITQLMTQIVALDKKINNVRVTGIKPFCCTIDSVICGAGQLGPTDKIGPAI